MFHEFRDVPIGRAPMRCYLTGRELAGVRWGLDFLRRAKGETFVDLGANIVVVGGGNVAIDVVRSAIRKGSKEVFVVYRRSRDEMPALDEEIVEAEEEGITIHYLAAPTRVIASNGKLSGLECIRMELGEPDESGRRRPVPISGSEFTLEVDSVVPAIGQSIDLSLLSEGKEWGITKRGTLENDPVTCATVATVAKGASICNSGPVPYCRYIGPASADSVLRAWSRFGCNLHPGNHSRRRACRNTPCPPVREISPAAATPDERTQSRAFSRGKS